MTETDNSDASQTPNSNDKEMQEGKVPIRTRIHNFIHNIFGRKPAYRITPNGVEVRYFNLEDTDTLPFDRETYSETQVFLGNWANPWHIDFESLKEEYPDFTEQKITSIQDVFGRKHVYPSQRWKLLANQNALRDMFVGGAIDDDRIMRLLYIAVAGIGLIGLLLLFGG